MGWCNTSCYSGAKKERKRDYYHYNPHLWEGKKPKPADFERNLTNRKGSSDNRTLPCLGGGKLGSAEVIKTEGGPRPSEGGSILGKFKRSSGQEPLFEKGKKSLGESSKFRGGNPIRPGERDLPRSKTKHPFCAKTKKSAMSPGVRGGGKGHLWSSGTRRGQGPHMKEVN